MSWRRHRSGLLVPGGVIYAETSCDFSTDEAMHRNPGTRSEETAFTVSLWVKLTTVDVQQVLTGAGKDSNDHAYIEITSGNVLRYFEQDSGSTKAQVLGSTALSVDTWYHLVIAVDTSQATAADRVRMYVDGVEETETHSTSPAQNYQSWFTHERKATTYQAIGAGTNSDTAGDYPSEFTLFLEALITEIALVPGSQLTPSSFAEDDLPKDISALDFGTDGFWLRFDDDADMGNDEAGNGDFTLVNISAADQSTDVPS